MNYTTRFPQKYLEVVILAYRATNRFNAKKRLPDFKKLEPRDQFTLIAVALEALLTIAIHELQAQVG